MKKTLIAAGLIGAIVVTRRATRRRSPVITLDADVDFGTDDDDDDDDVES